MLWGFIIVLLLTTGEIERYESPPLPLAECLTLQQKEKAIAEQRMDLRGLIVTTCEIVPLIAMSPHRSMTLIIR